MHSNPFNISDTWNHKGINVRWLSILGVEALPAHLHKVDPLIRLPFHYAQSRQVACPQTLIASHVKASLRVQWSEDRKPSECYLLAESLGPLKGIFFIAQVLPDKRGARTLASISFSRMVCPDTPLTSQQDAMCHLPIVSLMKTGKLRLRMDFLLPPTWNC